MKAEHKARVVTGSTAQVELPQEIREEIPPQEEGLWANSPGDLVWQYIADREQEAQGTAGFSWQVRRLEPGKHFQTTADAEAVPFFEASTPYRACYTRGSSPEEAVGALIQYMCELGREGAINPSTPYLPGSPPIQHAMHILTERLLQAVERRKDHMLMGGYAEIPEHVGVLVGNAAGEAKDDEQSKRARDAAAEVFNEQLVRTTARDSEIIAALATAVSALARVKDL